MTAVTQHAAETKQYRKQTAQAQQSQPKPWNRNPQCQSCPCGHSLYITKCKILNPASNLTSSLPNHHAQTQQSVLRLWNKESMHMQVCYFE